MRKFPKDLPEDFRIFKGIKTPIKIQDFLDTIPMNFERDGDTCLSPLMVLRQNRAHCIEGAMLAAAILWYHGEKPLLLDLKTIKSDESHVLALFKRKGLWGAISKTNHGVLRYRDPIFRTIRELVLSYFNEYYLDNGLKSLRSFSGPFNLLRYGNYWLTDEDNLWNIVNDIDRAKHFKILKGGDKILRKADKIEIDSVMITEWKQN